MPVERRYLSVLTASLNRKGVLDVDTVKGCTEGIRTHGKKGCYDACYAAQTARVYGIDFTASITRRPVPGYLHRVLMAVWRAPARWYRIGVAGDPSHDWENTVTVCELLRHTKKIPVIVTKHWFPATDDQLRRLAKVGTVFNTSTSGMDTDDEVDYRIGQLRRVAAFGMRSVCRVVTCDYGFSKWALECATKQTYLLSLIPIIDTPLRVPLSHPHVTNGDITITKRADSIGGGARTVSVHNETTYLGTCAQCPDQCGVVGKAHRG